MKAYNLTELSTEDKKLRVIAHNLCLKYSVPIHLSDDFLSEAYLKANRTYFSKNKYVSIGGMFDIIKSLILDYTKLNYNKKTVFPDDDFIFDSQEEQPLNYEAELLKDLIYENQIDAVTSLSDEDITTILLTIQTSFRQASVYTDKTIHYLRKNKARILLQLRNITN